MTSTAIISGSLGAIAQQQNKSIAETFISADCIVIVDTSGSMAATDSRGGQSRYDVACEELAALQNSLPGKIAVISFSGQVMFCPNGKPYNFGDMTDMARALQFTKVADFAGMRFILISDGHPDDSEKTLQVARTYKNRIDTIYVGPETEPYGRDFLEELARISGGQATTADRAQELAEKTIFLLQSGQ